MKLKILMNNILIMERVHSRSFTNGLVYYALDTYSGAFLQGFLIFSKKFKNLTPLKCIQFKITYIIETRKAHNPKKEKKNVFYLFENPE